MQFMQGLSVICIRFGENPPHTLGSSFYKKIVILSFRMWNLNKANKLFDIGKMIIQLFIVNV